MVDIDSFYNNLSEHVSRQYVLFNKSKDEQVINPRVPSNYMTDHNFEDSHTKRISSSPTIDGCLKGLSKNLKGKVLFVHEVITDEVPFSPSVEQVPDKHITGEVWFRKPVKLKLLGIIKVVSDDGKDGEVFTYGNGKYTATLYGWKYKWLKIK